MYIHLLNTAKPYLQQATDYYRGVMPLDFTYKNPAKAVYVRPAAVTAAYAAATPPVADITRADLEKRHSISPAHIQSASSRLATLICNTVASTYQRKSFKKRCKSDGLELLRSSYPKRPGLSHHFTSTLPLYVWTRQVALSVGG